MQRVVPGIHASEHVTGCELDIDRGVFGAIDRSIESAAAGDGIIGAPAFEYLVPAAAGEIVDGIGAAHAVDAARNRIGSDRCIAGNGRDPRRSEDHGHAG